MKLRLTALFFLLIAPLSAQKDFTLQQATFGQWRDFAPTTFDFVQWKKASNEFSYLVGYKTLMLSSAKNSWKPEELTDLGKYQAAVSKFATENKLDIAATDIPYFPYDYEWMDNDHIVANIEGNDFVYHIKFNPSTNKIELLTRYSLEAEEIKFSADHQSVAFTMGNNLYFMSGKDEKPRAITNDENPGIVNGNGYVHRQEFGIDNGIFWSPKAIYIAYYRKDETMVAEYPLVNSAARIAEAKMIRYPMAGEKSEEVTLVIYNVKTQQKTTLKTDGDKEQYLTSITWDPSEKFIYVGILNRGQNHLMLNQYDATSGNLVKTLFEEKHEKYVEPLHALTFLPTNPNQFIFQSERDGYNHLYLYDTGGNLVKQLTKGEFVVTELAGFDSKGENVFFVSNMDDVIGRQVASVNIKTGRINKITKNPGTHSGSLSFDGSYWIDFFNSTEVINTIEMLQTKSGKKAPLLTALNPYGGYNMPDINMVKLTAADGKTPLYGRITTPPNMDKNKKYPVVVYVYGGPHAQLVTNEWFGGASLFDLYMAQKGFIMFTVDNRGSEGRGMEFENVIHRQLGQNEMADQMKGIEYLKTLGYVDQNRIGVYGWSFGGFMSISLMLNQSSTFKVGVAGGPVCDWKYYEIMYGERYMDTPKENPTGFDKTSVVNKAGQLEGKLLVIHGAQDDVVVQQHSLEFIKACIKAGKPVDYFVYPDHKHNVRGNDRVHLYEKISRYFMDYL